MTPLQTSSVLIAVVANAIDKCTVERIQPCVGLRRHRIDFSDTIIASIVWSLKFIKEAISKLVPRFGF